MGEVTGIEWARSTFNPWIGCTKISPACDHCYAEERDGRFHAGVHWGVGAPRMLTGPANWREPLKWNERAQREQEADPSATWRVFCGSQCDWADKEIDPDWLARLIRLIELTPHLTWMLLTKRIGRAVEILPSRWLAHPPPHVWIGATMADQEEYDRDIRKLMLLPFPVRFISVEPMLGPMRLGSLYPEWVIAGGESGSRARPMHPSWPRELMVDCRERSIPFFFKQWGEWLPETQQPAISLNVPSYYWIEDRQGASKIGKKLAGELLDGNEYKNWPQSRQGV